ncbi:MAG: carboxypeptidase regulatory-like domain-containing protein, partial [candidate division WOR-3 bacterium]
NYLWDNHPGDPPDSSWIMRLSQRYADSTYGSVTTRLMPINGFDWYEVHGSLQDNTFGIYGGLSWTIETGYPNNLAQCESICLANGRALLDMLRLAGWGMHGRVIDSLSGAGLFARIVLVDPIRWNTYTNLPTGDFHKVLPPGRYTVQAQANGYQAKTLSLVVPETGAVQVVFALRSDTGVGSHAQRISWVRRPDPTHAASDHPTQALGPPDGLSYTIGRAGGDLGEVVLEADPVRPFRNRLGDDLEVFATGSYTVAVANDLSGPWSSLGPGNGRRGFDLAAAGLDSAQYVRIQEGQDCHLDAVSFGELGIGLSEDRIALEPRLSLTVVPSYVVGRAQISVAGPPGARVVLEVIDLVGRTQQRFDLYLDSKGKRAILWEPRTGPDGIYFCRLSSPLGSESCKIVVGH